MKVILAGTPAFAAQVFKPLIESGNFDIAAIATNPVKAADRGRLTQPPVAELAEKHGIKLLQFDKISAPEGLAELKKLGADLMLTAAFGQILSDEVISLFPKGVLNVHGSLLPKYRGASPIQAAILAGDKVTGVTIMRTVREIDAGDILLIKQVEIQDNDTAGDLFEKLADLGAEAAYEALNLVKNGRDKYTPQNHNQATHTKMIKKSDGKIDFSQSAKELELQVRAYQPWPGTFFSLFGKKVKIFCLTKAARCSTMYVDRLSTSGTVLVANPKDGWFVQCGDGVVELGDVQIEGGKRMSAKQFLLGHSVGAGTTLS
jgi:methionyl-tRNA formyltransferase